MAKKTLSGRTKGKTMGRSSGPLVWNEKVGRKVTPKMNNAINSKK